MKEMTEQTTTRSYAVLGMTCDHCRASVSEELAGVPGVEEVAVELKSGAVDIRGADLDDEQIGAAVQRAGYRLDGER